MFLGLPDPNSLMYGSRSGSGSFLPTRIFFSIAICALPALSSLLHALLRQTELELQEVTPESIERFIEDQAFLPLYDLAPPLTPSPISCHSFSVFYVLLVEVTDGDGVGEELNHTTTSKRGPLLNSQYSLG
jgi:hypothetical protein